MQPLANGQTSLELVTVLFTSCRSFIVMVLILIIVVCYVFVVVFFFFAKLMLF